MRIIALLLLLGLAGCEDDRRDRDSVEHTKDRAVDQLRAVHEAELAAAQKARLEAEQARLAAEIDALQAELRAMQDDAAARAQLEAELVKAQERAKELELAKQPNSGGAPKVLSKDCVDDPLGC